MYWALEGFLDFESVLGQERFGPILMGLEGGCMKLLEFVLSLSIKLLLLRL